jgi:hypothetical protein
MTTLTRSRVGLGPLRTALEARATKEAERLVAVAEAEGSEAVAAARRRADAMLQEARDQGRRDGEELVEVELATARRRARARVLAEQGSAYQRLRALGRHTVRAVLDEPEDCARMVAVLRARLGDAAAVSDTADGGLRAIATDGRTVDASVGTLADAVLATLDLEPLWSDR